MDIIALSTLLIKLDDGTEHLINYDFVNHKIYPSDVLSQNDTLRVINAIKNEAQQDVDIPEPQFVDQKEIEEMIENIEAQGKYDDSGTI
jgi:hypothetical protein